MYTTIKTKTGKVINFVTQQYEVGTYCIIDNDPSQQFSFHTKEDKFHINLRKKAIKAGDKVTASSPIPVTTRKNKKNE